jgi:FtsP/CotA-like multicopper oxidase with cupredoxin domain
VRRRQFLALAGGWASAGAFGLNRGHIVRSAPGGASRQTADTADITLRISEITWELAPGKTIKTLAYNDRIPGPLLRVPLGSPLSVDVINDSREDEVVHWHGFHIPSEVDGSIEEGTPPVPARGRRRYAFTPDPAGTRWYHSHGMANRNLKKSTYSGQFGMAIVENKDEPAPYDQDVPLLLHEWEPRFTNEGPLDVEFRYFSVNGKMLGAGEPIRVKSGQRILFRIVNASATLAHRLALPAHQFLVTALDGNRVPSPIRVPVLDLAPGERVDAIVEMNQPGVWLLGALRQQWRDAGMGIVVEYSGQQGTPRWLPQAPFTWDYGTFGGAGSVRPPDDRLTMVFRAADDGHHWKINGKSYPHTDPIVVEANKRYRWLFDNQTAQDHPVHLHRHTFEVVRVADRAMSGILKDVVVVPAWRQVEVDVTANHPGLTLFHCHQQFHMDMGFMTIMKYSG